MMAQRIGADVSRASVETVIRRSEAVHENILHASIVRRRPLFARAAHAPRMHHLDLASSRRREFDRCKIQKIQIGL